MLHTLSGALLFLFCYSGFLFVIALGVINLAGWRKHASKKRKCAFCAFSLGLKNDDYALGRQPLARWVVERKGAQNTNEALKRNLLEGL